jgi:hypothetical protein
MYFVTTLRVLDTVVDDCRTVGYFKEYGDAYKCCMDNALDIFECGYYQYAVITFVEEGLYPNKVEQQWFTINEENDVSAIVEYHKSPDAIGDYRPYIIG